MSRIIQHSRNHRETLKMKAKDELMQRALIAKNIILQINGMRRPLYGTPLDSIVMSDGEWSSVHLQLQQHQ